MTLDVEQLSPIGAVLNGVDIDQLLHDDRLPAQVMDVLEENGVVVFPAIGVDDSQQVAFSRRLGDVIAKTGPGVVGRGGDYPEIYQIGFGPDLNNELYVKGAFAWHLDGTMDDVPSKASLLSGRVLAAVGGDTQFVSTYAAYDRLSAEEQERFADLRVVHGLEAAYRTFDPDPSAETLVRIRSVPSKVQPLVWTHRSGRKSLVLGSTATSVVGMPDDEGKALLADLLSRATEPSQVLTHKWTVGDLVIWDNRGTLHRATYYAEDSGRNMHRVTLAGDEPIA